MASVGHDSSATTKGSHTNWSIANSPFWSGCTISGCKHNQTPCLKPIVAWIVLGPSTSALHLASEHTHACPSTMARALWIVAVLKLHKNFKRSPNGPQMIYTLARSIVVPLCSNSARNSVARQIVGKCEKGNKSKVATICMAKSDGWSWWTFQVFPNRMHIDIGVRRVCARSFVPVYLATWVVQCTAVNGLWPQRHARGGGGRKEGGAWLNWYWYDVVATCLSCHSLVRSLANHYPFSQRVGTQFGSSIPLLCPHSPFRRCHNPILVVQARNACPQMQIGPRVNRI